MRQAGTSSGRTGVATPVKTLDEATAAFLGYSPPTMDRVYNLDRMHALMKLLGNPQDSLRVIHIAGTSGKTSTAYFIRNLLEAAGKRTGLTISPHIVAINERVQVNGAPLAAKRFLSYVNRFFVLLADAPLQPTYFELLVALAYWIFAEEKVDYAVIETGLGGLLDGTNVVTRPDKLCVITDIGLDHTEILGDTLAKIAAQKAGIIQPYNQVVLNRQPEEAMRIIEDVAERQHARLVVAKNSVQPWSHLPDFQRRNWSLATAVYRELMLHDELPELTVPQLVRASQLMPPGRWEQYQYRDKTILLDGAHNPQKLEALIGSLRASGVQQAAVLANFVEAPSQKIHDALTVLQPLATTLIIPEFTVGQDLKGRRSIAATQLEEQAAAQHFPNVKTCPDVRAALQKLLACPESMLLITGSLYLVSRVRPLVREIAVPARGATSTPVADASKGAS
jgi:dihydrofolate synthase/folylpolyglutamate synthase